MLVSGTGDNHRRARMDCIPILVLEYAREYQIPPDTIEQAYQLAFRDIHDQLGAYLAIHQLIQGIYAGRTWSFDGLSPGTVRELKEILK